MTTEPDGCPAGVADLAAQLARLVQLAESERVAVESRRWSELLEIQAEQRSIVDSLPDEIPRAAKPYLEHARDRQRETESALVGALAETKGILERLSVGLRTAVAYGSRSPSTVETTA